MAYRSRVSPVTCCTISTVAYFAGKIGSSRTVTARALVAADVADLYRGLLDEGRSLTNCFARVPNAACSPARWRRTIVES